MGNKFFALHNINNLFSKKMQIAMIGLDGAGKTTILYRLKLKENVHSTMPTTAFNVDTVQPIKNLKLLVWDAAGSEDLRPLWKAYMRKADGIIFVVDSSDVQRFEEVKLELDEVLRTKESKGLPIMILANKQDKKTSVHPFLLAQELELYKLDSSVKWNLKGTAGRYGDGLERAMIQMADMINEKNGKIKSKNNDNNNSLDNNFEQTAPSAFI